MSALEGFITDKEVQQIEYLLQKVNLPITISSKIDYQDFIDAMSVTSMIKSLSLAIKPPISLCR
jgi:3-dehydroquinate synthetase